MYSHKGGQVSWSSPMLNGVHIPTLDTMHLCLLLDIVSSLLAGVSAAQSLDVNSLAVPRAAKEAIGGIARLTHTSGRAMTINVEYNQLDPLLRATGHSDGDVADSSGFSPYPGAA